MLVDVAGAGEFGSGCTPGAWVGASRGNILGHRAGREEPGRDGRASPFSCVDTAASVVESASEGLGVGAHDCAACVGGLAICVDVAVICVEFAAETGVLNSASIAGVQGHLVSGLVVDAFDDINFTIGGPVGAKHPECRPGAAHATRHVGKIEDDKAVLVCFGAFEADTLPARLAGGVGVVHADVNSIAGGGVDQTVALGDIAIDIVHVAVGGIGVLDPISISFQRDLKLNLP